MRRFPFASLALLAACGGAETYGTTSSTTGTGGSFITSITGTGGTTSTGGTGGVTGSSTTSTTSTSGTGCTVPADCPGADSDCNVRACDAGVCGRTNLAAGTVAATQTAGDCLRALCDGLGGITTTADLTDVPIDGNPCTDDLCTGGSPANPPSAAGAPCATGNGKVCDGAGACVPCNATADCASGVCVAHACVTPSCADAVMDGAETDIDCGGGTCPTCAPGKHCQKDADCLTAWCGSAKICLIPDCLDAVKNGTETDLDCGGPVCARCLPGKHCAVGSDCTSAICTGGVCQTPTCSDAAKNAAETDVDCGGGTCPKCAVGKGCAAAGDCLSAVCSGGACQAATCADLVKNGAESDVDCGGATCPKCAVGKLCGAPADCASAVCTGGVCQAPSCTDGLLDNGETDVDCGGPNCAKCPAGKVCVAASDCQNAVCTGGVCQAPTCTDGVQNGSETGVDCGGSCASCPTLLLVGTSPSGLLGAELHPGGSWIGSTLADASAHAPSLTFTSTGHGVLVITSQAGPGEVHTATWTSAGWSAPALVAAGAISRAAPAVEASGTGVAHLVYQSPQYLFWYLAYAAAPGWTAAPEQVGTAQSYGPVPASIAAVGATPTAAFLDGQSPNVNWAAARDRVGGSWQARVDIAGSTDFNVTPALAALSSGPELMMVYVQSDTKLMSVTRTGGAWSTPAYLNNCLSNDRPALAALPNGGAMLAFRGTDGMLYWSRYTGGAWSAVAPFSSPNVAVSAPPAVAPGMGGKVAEIAFVEGDGKAYHARHDGTAWGAPVQVGGTSLVGVAIASSP